MVVAKNNKFGVGGNNNYKDKIVEQSLFKNLNRVTGYSILNAK